MHDDRVLWQALHDAFVNDVLPASLVIILWPVLEPLFLYAGLIQHFNIRRYFLKTLYFFPLHPPANSTALAAGGTSSLM